MAIGGLLLFMAMNPSVKREKVLELPQKQTAYANLRLGMAMAEVIYVKGFPQNVIQNPENLKNANKTEWWLAYPEVYPTNTLKNGQHVEDYRTWWYELDDRGTRIDVSFDATTKTLNQISCFSKAKRIVLTCSGSKTEREKASFSKNLANQPTKKLMACLKKLDTKTWAFSFIYRKRGFIH
jgi:hypothetical protein